MKHVELRTTDIEGAAWVDQFCCDFPQSPQYNKLMCKVAFSLFSHINQSAYTTLD